jgi:hypothetical protein
MDGRQFDDLLRTLTDSRRSILGGSLAAVVSWLGIAETTAKKKRKKREKKRRCNAQNCAHGCCKTPHGPCGSGVVDWECGFAGKPCKVCTGTTSCREPERGACCQMPSGDCTATRCCYEHAGQTACVDGKCCIIHDSFACKSSLECCEPTPFCINGKCTAGCFEEVSRNGGLQDSSDDCCAAACAEFGQCSSHVCFGFTRCCTQASVDACNVPEYFCECLTEGGDCTLLD